MTEYRQVFLDGKKPNQSTFLNLVNDKRYIEVLSEMKLWNSISFAILDYAIMVTGQLKADIENELKR